MRLRAPCRPWCVRSALAQPTCSLDDAVDVLTDALLLAEDVESHAPVALKVVDRRQVASPLHFSPFPVGASAPLCTVCFRPSTACAREQVAEHEANVMKLIGPDTAPTAWSRGVFAVP